MERSNNYIKKAREILHSNGEEAQITIKSIKYGDHDIYILIFDSISSTMLISENWDPETLDSTSFAFIARAQPQGRGQAKNKWSGPNGNLMVTYMTKSLTCLIQCFYLVSVISISGVIRESFELDSEVKFKWVNDIFLGDRKVSGVLLKSDIYGEDVIVQIGVGINLNTSPIEGSTSILEHIKNAQQISLEEIDTLAEKLFIRILNTFSTLPQSQEHLLEEYNKKLQFQGEQVKIFDMALQNVELTGKFIRLNEFGNAMIEKENGEVVTVHSGKMRKE